MKKLTLLLTLFFISFSIIQAQSTDETKVSIAIEILKKTMIDPDRATLEKITHKDLSYGHSNGLIENQTMFIEALVSGNSDFKSIDLSEQTVQIVGSTAIVRHKLSAETANKGVVGTTKLNVLLIYQKIKGNWVLLARQAAKIV
jgi:hypothetical protein